MSSTQEERASASGSLKERPFARLLQHCFANRSPAACTSPTEPVMRVTSTCARHASARAAPGGPRPPGSASWSKQGLSQQRRLRRSHRWSPTGCTWARRWNESAPSAKRRSRVRSSNSFGAELIRLFRVAQEIVCHLPGSDSLRQEGDELAARVDRELCFFPAIRAAYDVPRATRELSRLWGQEFRLAAVSPADVAAMGIPSDESPGGGPARGLAETGKARFG